MDFLDEYKTYLNAYADIFKFDFEDDNINIDSQYTNNKSASTGEDIKCPMCGTIFTKKQYSQAFCCTQCKDDYWNLKRGKKEPVEVKYSSNVVETQLKELLGR